MPSLTALTTENADKNDKEPVNDSRHNAAYAPDENRNFLSVVTSAAKHRVRYFVVLIPALISILVSGCGSIDIKRITYDVLRQQDCLHNNFDELCTRSFALDYFDYTQARKHYLQTISHGPKHSPVNTVLVSTAEKIANVEPISSLPADTPRSQLDPAL